eukprot:gb/GECH01011782.1/.p1 GENE.gb/GECH01011782.1/~~gb/GECH01011782.1/.p1  ORF type:complete len:160 (+),score=52.10 gb/GECH01011782.1/:1-480(+)
MSDAFSSFIDYNPNPVQQPQQQPQQQPPPEQQQNQSPAYSISDFRGLDVLQTPTWMLDLTHQRVPYANPAALELWQVKSREHLEVVTQELLGNETTRYTLEQYLTRISMGEKPIEFWNFYPDQEHSSSAVAVCCFFKSVLIENTGNCLLVEGHVPNFNV